MLAKLIRRLIVAGLLLTGLAMAAPGSVQALPKGCLPGIGKKVPVLFVHGFNSQSTDWRGNGSLEQKVSRIKEAGTDQFDYENYNTRWITDQNIGPSLAREIACRAQSSREEGGRGEVIVIGHSMGGLAAQYAANQTVNGRRVADDIGLAIPIASPFKGSQVADWAMTLARTFCASQHITRVGEKPISVDPDDCEAALDIYTAIGGLRQDSAKLRELPPFPPDVPVHTIAGNVKEAKFNIFGVELKPLDTDLVVTTDSATKGYAHPAHGGGKSVVECVGVWPIPAFSDASCEHGNMLTDVNVQTRVVDAIHQYLRRAKLDQEGGRFIGEWYGSGSLTFNEDGTGKKIVYYGSCDMGSKYLCQVHTRFAWQVSGDKLALTIHSVKPVAVTEEGEILPAPAGNEMNLSKYPRPGATITLTAQFQSGSPGYLTLDGGEDGLMYSGGYCHFELPISPRVQPLCGH